MFLLMLSSVTFTCLSRVLKDIKVFHVASFIVVILMLLSVVTYFVPDEGWELGGMKFQFLTKEDFYTPKKQEKADITDLLATIDTSMVATDPSIIHQNGSNGNLGAANGGDVSEDASTELQTNAAGKENLHAFFKVLHSAAADRKKISILHYGDSQIEGDRMTSYIREKVQSQFGGYGPGLIPATNVYSTITYKQAYSENFQRFTCFGGPRLESRQYGAMASASRFTPEYILDSINLDTMKIQSGWIEFQPSGNAYSRAKTYNNVKMHYNSCLAETALKVYQDGALIHEEDLITDGGQHTFSLSFPSSPGKLKYGFSGKVSPNICAFSLEGDYGVQVSNVGMRGTSANVIGGIKYNTIKAMHNELNTKLVIMQFGGNSVVHFKDSAGVRSSVYTFKKYINVIQQMNPDAMVVVIGPSDMSKLDDQIYETYPLLPYFVTQLKDATIASGAGFWNLYAAMGGKNSMPAWVEKGLAGNDHTHFTNGGAKFASQLFYNALIAEYAKWKNSQ